MNTNIRGDSREKGKTVRYMAVESCEKVRRNVFCRNYGECLDYTIGKKWPGFSCQSCESYELEMLDGTPSMTITLVAWHLLSLAAP